MPVVDGAQGCVGGWRRVRGAQADDVAQAPRVSQHVTAQCLPGGVGRQRAFESLGHRELVAAGQAGDLLDLLDVESRTVAATLRTRSVSRAVNNVRTLDRTDPSLIEPLP